MRALCLIFAGRGACAWPARAPRRRPRIAPSRRSRPRRWRGRRPAPIRRSASSRPTPPMRSAASRRARRTNGPRPGARSRTATWPRPRRRAIRRKPTPIILRAWRLYYFGQWPAPTSAGKQAAYKRGVEAYLLHAKYFDPPLEIVRIPFEGSEIVGYLRLPANAPRPVPLVLAISGLDSRKETVAETYAAALPQGIGFFAVDSPGTGQAPLKAGESSERMYSRVLDYLATRQEIDGEPHPRARPEFRRLLGRKTRAHRGEAAGRRRHPVAADPPHLPERFFPRPDVHPRISVRSRCRRASTSTASHRPTSSRLPAKNVAASAGAARQTDGADAAWSAARATPRFRSTIWNS